MADMYYNDRFNTMRFLALLTILLITVWSRLDVGCVNMMDVMLGLTMGFGIGVAYYLMFKDYYLGDEEKQNLDASRSDPELINNVFKYFNYLIN